MKEQESVSVPNIDISFLSIVGGYEVSYRNEYIGQVFKGKKGWNWSNGETMVHGYKTRQGAAEGMINQVKGMAI